MGNCLFSKTAPNVEHESFFEYSGLDGEGNMVPFSKFVDQIVLVINVASK